MQVGVASREARGGDSNELLFAAVSSLEGGEIIDANEQLASVARESEIHPLLIVERKQSKNLRKTILQINYGLNLDGVQ